MQTAHISRDIHIFAPTSLDDVYVRKMPIVSEYLWFVQRYFVELVTGGQQPEAHMINVWRKRRRGYRERGRCYADRMNVFIPANQEAADVK